MPDNTPKPVERRHKATYSRDKKKGGYLVRVEGPTANAFAGRKVPVTVTGGAEHEEELISLVWAGVETSGEYGTPVGTPVALYTFKATPKGESEVLPF